MSARFLFDKSIALSQYAHLNKLGLRVAFSVKTNPLVAQALEDETSCEFTVHPSEDLSRLKDLSRVWYYAHAWDAEEINTMLSRGITRFIVDNEEDLDELLAVLENRVGDNTKIDLLLRAKLKEFTVFTGKHYVFGMDAKVVNARIAELKGHARISTLGVHVHRKSQNVSEWSLKRELGNTLSEESLDSIALINIGGGLPSRYANSSDKAIDSIFKKIQEFVAFAKEKGLEVMAEPGRYIAAPSMILETEVKSVHGNTVIVDASVYNSAMDTLIVPLKLLVEGELEEGGKRYTVKGCTPCSMDIFRYAVRLAEPPKIGDRIRFLNAGAYNFRTEFCDLPQVDTLARN